MTKFDRMKEWEWVLGFVSRISSVGKLGHTDRLEWAGPLTLGRKATKLAVFSEKQAFKNFMKRAKDIRREQKEHE